MSQIYFFIGSVILTWLLKLFRRCLQVFMAFKGGLLWTKEAIKRSMLDLSQVSTTMWTEEVNEIKLGDVKQSIHPASPAFTERIWLSLFYSYIYFFITKLNSQSLQAPPNSPLGTTTSLRWTRRCDEPSDEAFWKLMTRQWRACLFR